MIKSMTAFARHAEQAPWGELVWELRSVNHRYLDILPRLPEDLRKLEEAVRQKVGKRLKRGKVECTLRYRAAPENVGELVVNREFAKALAHASREVDALLYSPSSINSFDLLRWPGVLEVHEGDLEPVLQAAVVLLEQALDTLVETREREGTRLHAFLHERLSAMRTVVAKVQARLPEVLALQRQRLRLRLSELAGQLDQGRLEQEMALLIQKADVDEEIERLEAHVEEVARVLETPEPVGRRLDFLMQELNREANTLGSKSIDVETTRAAVDLKVLVEQMREQIQNIE